MAGVYQSGNRLEDVSVGGGGEFLGRQPGQRHPACCLAVEAELHHGAQHRRLGLGAVRRRARHPKRTGRQQVDPCNGRYCLTVTVIAVTVNGMAYTLDELVGAVTSRLQAAGLDRQTNGQVSAFPDRRTLRYYTTIGLMDRPDAMRDRQAIYGDRHVTQAVAVKRLQASGLALAAIQHRLMGLPLPQVEAIAAGQTIGEIAAARPRRFWTEAAAALPESPGPTRPIAAAGPVRPAPMAPARGARPAPPPWSAVTQPEAIAMATPKAAKVNSDAALMGATPDLGARPMVAIALAGGATLLVATDRLLTPGDIAGIRAAAALLIEHIDQLPAAGTGADLDRKDHR
jgi:DNA-binding transcriptional MerR regulator